MQRVLSLEQAPSLSVPLRFLLTAPAFAIAAALLLLWEGPSALASRWSPVTLALTHLLTLGVLSMAMTGALLQLLPVVAGATPARLTLTVRIVHPLLTLGTIILATAFWLMKGPLFQLAILVLGTAFGCLLLSTGIGMRKLPGSSATISAMRLALVALFITVVLGLTLAAAFGWSLSMPLIAITDLHARWGLLGWVGLLLAGVAYQVIPMFQVTPLYADRFAHTLAPVMFAILLLWSALTAIGVTGSTDFSWLDTAGSWLMALTTGSFALYTMRLLWQRKRPKADVTTRFWHLAMLSLLGCCVVWAITTARGEAPAALTLGVLFMVGVSYSAINGMLYKIVPFLIWYHLQLELKPLGVAVPNVKQIISEGAALRQFSVHSLALLLLTGATWWPAMLARPAAALMAISSLMLLRNLLHAARLYRTVRNSVPTHATSPLRSR